ncbi:MAG: DUF362 domain-containing protein [Armatimonadetes bacterium]|nr:DUF362 domain-containing protein [Armatimonadota bacterium]
MNRREFLKKAAAIAGLVTGEALGAPPRTGGAKAATVALARDATLGTLEGAAFDRLLANLVHRALCDALNVTEPTQAWRRLFRPDDVVAVKVNCLAPEIAPRQGIIVAVTEGLAAAGVPQENIIVYDKEDRDLRKAGYELRSGKGGVQCYGTIGETEGPGYEERFTLVGDTSFRLSKIVTRRATAIINVPVAKQHEYAGVTGALKNHFGSIHNPEDFHKFACDPAVADVNKATPIRTKQRLVIMDATQVLYEGGPSYQPRYVIPYWAVMVSTDPVAIDAELVQLIEMCRQKEGLKSLWELDYTPKHVLTAGQQGLGVADVNSIDLRVYNRT